MVRNRRRRQSDCAEHEKSIQKQLCQRSYGLPYVNESGRTGWPLPQRIAFGHCQRLEREGFRFFDPASPGSPYWGARTTHAYNLWDATEKVLKEEFQRRGRTLKIREGAAPYYGPKINLMLRDPNGLYHIYGSIQLDVEMPEGFDLGYIGDDRKRHRPVLIHRAIVPPAETILAIISTQCGECASSMYCINPICPKDSKGVEANFECAGTLNRRIKNSIGSKPNFTLVVGRTEIANGTVNVRTRNDLVLGEFTIKEVLRQFRCFEEEYSTDRQCIEAFMRCRGPERSWFP
ncbi:unnamed protein product [Haemonchus placei]|uniref:HGTP_anticodon domain-containing protein n=1 Tax=Haemonchus placei TaxID=6290 RepID=A0A0N4WE77_HAEPC|nr:unnamed protein product [Haemonchus placei]